MNPIWIGTVCFQILLSPKGPFTTSVTITWDSGNPDPVTHYIIQYRAKSPDSKYETVEDITTTRYSIGGLYPNTEYEIRVSAVNSIGQGPPSEPVETRTGQPSKFQVGAVSDTSIELTWEPAYEKEGIISYELRYKEGNFGTQGHFKPYFVYRN
ncbi:hypothetical protein GOODEAATRI_024670 [Goodea atripinnis]|uniref:Fibronectin type-III domain-containing protein n=1 Tax=Goodea atripinnis TaxID=208336 RepID=A0ABV0MV06_9TELE